MNNKTKYTAFCNNYHDQVSVFLQPWWLDIVCEINNWDVIIYEKDNQIIAALPYMIRKKATLKYIQSTPLTPAIGLYMKEDAEITTHLKLKNQRNILRFLFENLPTFDVLSMKLSGDILDWRPLHWAGFQQSTWYSSSIINDQLPERVFESYKSNLRRDIRKGMKHLKVRKSNNASQFYHLISSSYERKGMKTSFSKEVFINIFEASLEKEIGHSLVTVDSDDNVVGGIFCVEDHKTIYYLFGGIDSNFDTRGSQSLLMHEAILLSLKKGKSFDFEGSMNEGIDRFFMSFNPSIVPYHFIRKSNSKLFNIKKAIF